MWIYSVILIYISINSCTEAATGDKSKAKCRDYAQYVYAMEDSPVMGRRAQRNKVSTCAMTAVPLVIGGIKTIPKEFPHMAVIGYKTENSPKIDWKCGGTLISENFVLTAAHCITEDNDSIERVRLGEVNFETQDESQIQERKVVQEIAHPDYDRETRYYDIALIKLDKPVQFNAYVRPACLNTVQNLPHTEAIATGFGKTKFESSSMSKHLMKVTLKIIPKTECSSYFESEIKKGRLPNGLDDSVMCAGELKGGKDTCQGDSGGPLQVALREPYCMYSIIGVVSFGKFCGYANQPAIYTSVYHYLPWIEDVVW